MLEYESDSIIGNGVPGRAIAVVIMLGLGIGI
jgi:hypothetical protein